MILYRAMCKEEFDATREDDLAFRKRFKWLGTKEFVESRVTDGKFNNSKFKPERYTHMVEVFIPETEIPKLSKVSESEVMIDRRSNIKVRVKKLGEI